MTTRFLERLAEGEVEAARRRIEVYNNRRYSRVLQMEAALLHAQGHTWQEVGDWQIVQRETARQRGVKGGAYVVHILRSLLDEPLS